MSARICVWCNKLTDDPVCSRCQHITDYVNRDDDEPLEFEDDIEQVKGFSRADYPYHVKVYHGDRGYV